MHVEISNAGRPGRVSRFLAALPVAAGSLVIAVLRVGLGATVIVVVVAVPLIFAAMLAVNRLYLRRWSARLSVPSGAFVASASLCGAPGVTTVTGRSLDWQPGRGQDEPLEVSIAEIDSVSLNGIGVLFLKATEMTITERSSRKTTLTVTAPVDKLESALRGGE